MGLSATSMPLPPMWWSSTSALLTPTAATCLALRPAAWAPVPFLTALDGVHDKIVGFESDAGDYLTEPFELNEFDELVVRISTLARRGAAPPGDFEDFRLAPLRMRSVGVRRVSLTVSTTTS